MTIGLAADEPRAISMRCRTDEFSDVFEIPVDVLRPEKCRTYLAVDLAEPGSEPIITPGARIIRQKVFRAHIPWIMVTLFE